MAAGRPKKYTRKKLREETERYFRSISRTVLARDDTGGIIRNDDGDEIQILQYVVPPSIAGCACSWALTAAPGRTTQTLRCIRSWQTWQPKPERGLKRIWSRSF